MKIRFGAPQLGPEEKAAVLASLDQRVLTNGPCVGEFEELFRLYTQGGIAVAVSSCMAALHIACMIKVKPGSEVIVPALTHPATAHAVELVGATPIFVDVSRETGNITAQHVERAITPKTSAVMVVHFMGRIASMPAIVGLAEKHGLAVIEDCALALGARSGVHAGLLGDMGCFSFYPVKHITTGEGGMLLTKHPEVGRAARRIRSFGIDTSLTDNSPQVVALGLNYRMTEMQGALGTAQIKKANGWLNRRRENWQALAAQLSDFRFVTSNPGAYYGFAVFVPKYRDEVQRLLQSASIETSIYYRPIVPYTPYYLRKYGLGEYPNADLIANQTICLPCGPHLSRHQIAYIAGKFKEAVAKCA